MADVKYIEMLILSAQIETLVELPYNSVYKAGAKIGELQMKSAVFMDDVIKAISEKRGRLAVLNGGSEIGKLKGVIKEQAEKIEELESKIKELGKNEL